MRDADGDGVVCEYRDSQTPGSTAPLHRYINSQPPELEERSPVQTSSHEGTAKVYEARRKPGLFTTKERQGRTTRSSPGHQPQRRASSLTDSPVKITCQQSPPLDGQVRNDNRPQTRQCRGFPRGWGEISIIPYYLVPSPAVRRDRCEHPGADAEHKTTRETCPTTKNW